MSQPINITYLSAANPTRVELPEGARVLSAGSDPQTKLLSVWWQGDETNPTVPRIFTYYAVGRAPFDDKMQLKLLGFADSPNVGRVHIFEAKPWNRCKACGKARSRKVPVCLTCGETRLTPWWAWERRQSK